MQRIGVGLILLSIIGLAGYGIYLFFDTILEALPWPLKIVISCGIMGVLIVLVSLIRERIKLGKSESEKFKGVER